MKILYDSKEKMPWDFSIFGVEQEVTALKTGDYTLQGFENEIIIERKRTPNEVAINLGSKSKNFEKELQRMLEVFDHKYLICEFTMDDLISFPMNSGLHPNVIKKIKIKGKFLSSRLVKWCEEYTVDLFFTNNRSSAELLAYELLQDFYAKKV